MESGFTISGLLFEMAALTTDLDSELMPEKDLEDYCFFFLGRPKQNRPESQRYCADVEVTAICCKRKRRGACQIFGIADWKTVNWDM